MSVEYRKNRDRWGFRIAHPSGKRLKLYKWRTKEDAEKAFREYERIAKLPSTALRIAADAYQQDSLAKRSAHRLAGIAYNLERWIVPWFGPETNVNTITPKQIEQFVQHHVGRVKPITVWHYVKDLRALLNWCIKQDLMERNPVAKADLSLLRNRKAVKPPLYLDAIDRGIETLKGRERLYVDTLRFMGLRKDEGNRIRSEDVRDHGTEMWLEVRGTKTADSHRIIPIPPGLHAAYRFVQSESKPGEFLFSLNPQEKSYCRRRLFQRISKAAGIRVVPKDLRDYFASVVQDSNVASQMLGHTNLRTTGIYVRQIHSRMLEAVQGLASNGTPQNLEATFGGQLGQKKAPNGIEPSEAEVVSTRKT